MRAQARLRWFLHRTKIQCLSVADLKTIYLRLLAHHTRDFKLLFVIRREILFLMANSNQGYPWRCQCGSLNSKRAIHCPMCTQHWTTGTPHSNQPKTQQAQAHAQRWTQQRASTPRRNSDWDQGESQWGQDQWVKSPRQKSPRQRSNANKPKNAKGHFKGKGKGKVTLTSQAQAEAAPMTGPPAVMPTYQEAPWLMAPPPPIPAAPPSSTVPEAGVGAASAAEAKLRSMYALLEKYPEGLHPDILKEIQDAKVQEGEVAIKSLHKQVTALGRARTELRNANAARLGLHSSWRAFLVEQVAKWQAYSQQFQTQESQLAERVNNARLALETAKSNLAASKSILNKTEQSMDQSETVNVSDDEEESKESKEVANNSAQKITASLHHLGESLKTLSANADELMIAEQQACKRQRTDAGTENSPALPAPASVSAAPADGSSSFG